MELEKRYSRQITLNEIGLQGQLKLTNACVLVVGAGGLGCPVLQYLCAAGVGKLGIVDGDFVSESNLHRQILYTHQDIGKPKVECAAKRLKAMNPHVKMEVFQTLVHSKNAVDLISEYDIIVDGTDQIYVRYLLSDACQILNKPLVYAGIHKFQGQVSVFNFNQGPTYRDLFPAPPHPGSVQNCNEVGVLGILPGIVGLTQANEVLKIILGYGKVLSGMLWMFDAKNGLTQTISFDKLNGENKAPKTLKELEEMDYLSFCNPHWRARQD